MMPIFSNCRFPYIPQGYADKKKAYIASQGETISVEETLHTPLCLLHFCSLSSLPLSLLSPVGPTGVTVGRFWDMVWENKVPTIVMLTRCVEDGKVSTYILHPVTGSNWFI